MAAPIIRILSDDVDKAAAGSSSVDSLTASAAVADETGAQKNIAIAKERALTLYLDKHELLTLMTLGQMPAALAVGWLRNQQIIGALSELQEVVVDWAVDAAAVWTHAGNYSPRDWENERRTVTSGCGQGTMFNRVMESVQQVEFVRAAPLAASSLFEILQIYRSLETVYKTSGAVHGCALFSHQPLQLLCATEDIGRHNAVDAIAGWMWLNNVAGDDKVFYTTGRLTSEMVIKCAQMRIPFLISRSGVTQMGYDVANAVGITMVGRAINRRYLIFSGAAHFQK